MANLNWADEQRSTAWATPDPRSLCNRRPRNGRNETLTSLAAKKRLSVTWEPWSVVMYNVRLWPLYDVYKGPLRMDLAATTGSIFLSRPGYRS